MRSFLVTMDAALNPWRADASQYSCVVAVSGRAGDTFRAMAALSRTALLHAAYVSTARCGLSEPCQVPSEVFCPCAHVPFQLVLASSAYFSWWCMGPDVPTAATYPLLRVRRMALPGPMVLRACMCCCPRMSRVDRDRNGELCFHEFKSLQKYRCNNELEKIPRPCGDVQSDREAFPTSSVSCVDSSSSVQSALIPGASRSPLSGCSHRVACGLPSAPRRRVSVR